VSQSTFLMMTMLNNACFVAGRSLKVYTISEQQSTKLIIHSEFKIWKKKEKQKEWIKLKLVILHYWAELNLHL